MVDPITPDELIPEPRELVLRDGPPDTIAGWKALVDGLLTDQPCVFHRNLEISSRYAWIYKYLPAYFKWAGMAAFASHHVRLALFPFRLDRRRLATWTSSTAWVARKRCCWKTWTRSARRTTRSSTTSSGCTSRTALPTTGSSAYAISWSRAPLRPRPGRLRGDRPGAPILEDETASAEARQGVELVWKGNVQLLEHEQRALVQPNLDRLSCAFARLFSIGSALSFEVRGARHEFPTSRRSTSIRSHEGSRWPCEPTRGRGSPASTTAGAGSSRASFPASGDSMPTCPWSTPAFTASSPKRATMRPTPASSHAHPMQKMPLTAKGPPERAFL